ncbi:ferritin-like domain-containing protein [Ditylenchus destructor]|nr:ferritin-like domain-containing protein [Ditylenchus destructor]
MDSQTCSLLTEFPFRHNYSVDLETAINEQIHLELKSSYTYLALAFHFDGNDVALCNIAKWFARQSAEERQHAHKMCKWQNSRGGRVILVNLEKPDKNEWGSALEAFQAALIYEKNSNESLHNLHALASKNSDSQTCDFLEQNFLSQQVNLIEQIGKIIMSVTPKIFRICEFLEDEEFLGHKIDSAEELNKFLAHLKRIGKNLGEFIFDKDLEEKVQCLCLNECAGVENKMD